MAHNLAADFPPRRWVITWQQSFHIDFGHCRALVGNCALQVSWYRPSTTVMIGSSRNRVFNLLTSRWLNGDVAVTCIQILLNLSC